MITYGHLHLKLTQRTCFVFLQSPTVSGFLLFLHHFPKQNRQKPSGSAQRTPEEIVKMTTEQHEDGPKAFKRFWYGFRNMHKSVQ